MTAIAIAEPRSRLNRLWAWLVAAWGGLMGLLPHVLHHVGPLAGAAILAGATGRVVFAIVGFVAAIPMLRRLHRRYATWKVPALALAVFVSMFALSSFVIGPALSGSESPSPPVLGGGGDHQSHHP